LAKGIYPMRLPFCVPNAFCTSASPQIDSPPTYSVAVRSRRTDHIPTLPWGSMLQEPWIEGSTLFPYVLAPDLFTKSKKSRLPSFVYPSSCFLEPSPSPRGRYEFFLLETTRFLLIMKRLLRTFDSHPLPPPFFFLKGPLPSLLPEDLSFPFLVCERSFCPILHELGEASFPLCRL